MDSTADRMKGTKKTEVILGKWNVMNGNKSHKEMFDGRPVMNSSFLKIKIVFPFLGERLHFFFKVY